MRRQYGFLAPIGGDDMFLENFMKDILGDNSVNPVRNMSNMMFKFNTDIQETENSYIVEAELPGFNKEDISVDVEDGILTISAEMKSEDSKEDKNYIRRERRFGKYSRSFTFENINEDAISAKYSNGILKIELPKCEKNVSKKGINID